MYFDPFCPRNVLKMEPDGFIELEMESVGGEIERQPEEALTASNGSMDESNFRTRAYEGLHTRGQHQHSAPEVPQSSGLSVEVHSSDGSEASPRGKLKKDNGLRTKRVGKALKIQVFSQQEETERRRSHYAMTMAGSAPLYPLDLQDHMVDSSQDEESDRSSSISPEVAANGFGSPIELPSRDSFDELTRRHEENRLLGNVHGESASPLDEVPLTSKFETAPIENLESYLDDDLLQESDSGSGKSLTGYVFKTLILMLAWYALSTLLVLYNKILLGKEDRNFPAPLLMSTIHFSMQGVISRILVWCNPLMRPSVRVSWKDYFIRVVPTALSTALDVNLTNVSLKFLSVSFMTMCKSGSPVFLLIFAFLFKLEVPSYQLLGIIVVISTGVLLTVRTEATDFNLLGFIFIISASVMSGFRWTVTQLLLQKQEYGLNNPFATMSVLTPIMAVVSLVLSLILEEWRTLGQSKYFDSSLHILSSSALMLLGGTLAFFMVSTEYILLSETSAVTLTVAGIVKEMVTILVAVIFLKDQFTLLKGFGLAIIIFGVSLYNVFKYKKLKEKEHGGDHLSNNLNGTHNYVALKETKAVFEMGDELDDNIL